MSDSNPFLALFGEKKSETSNKNKSTISDRLEDIFGFTINPEHSQTKDLLYLEEINSIHGKTELDISLLPCVLFERLFMCNDNSILCLNPKRDKSHAYDTKVIHYLYTSYKKLHEIKLNTEDEAEVKDKIIQNVATAILPDIYSGPEQDIGSQVITILKEAELFSDEFVIESCKRVISEDNNNKEVLCKFVKSMNDKLTEELIKMSLVNVDHSVFNYFNVLISNELLAGLFIDCCSPNNVLVGSAFAKTPIGALLNLAVVPKVPGGKYEYFTNAMNQPSNTQEDLLWMNLDRINERVYSLLLSLLKSKAEVKNKTLTWLGNCLKSNSDRGKLWDTQAPPELNPAYYTSVTDGFMINICNVLLRMCQPFCSNFQDNKILKVDPTYCAVPNEKAEEKNIHMLSLSKETCFLPVASDGDLQEERPMANSYSFTSECFYMAHKAVDLGFRVGVDKLIRQNREMGRLERAYNDATMQMGGNSDLISTIRDGLNEEVSKYLSLKCQLSDPVLTQNMFNFVSATAYWLCQAAVHADVNDSSSYAPVNELPVNFPLSDKIPNTLKCIPEFFIENIVSFLVFLRHFSPKTLEEQSYEKLSPLFTFVLIYMGSQHHMYNPHVRARLAEALESLLPFHKDEPGTNLSGYQRQMLFNEHPHKLMVAENLLKVFVGIEMTGQSVEFEQKFNYRRPMYAVFDYLWKLPEHRKYFQCLAEDAERNMEALNPPLFLKFSNLLINDAIHLLDEALANMAKLKEMQHARDSGEWTNLNARERSQNMANMQQISNLARFDNILGKATITTLEKLTSEIDIVLTHATMVDRIAAMLNYFLLKLVGPNKKDFKVKDSKEYHFEPAATVLEICKIYVNLKENDAFCLAVSQDGRSYSPNLFSLAEDVLIRIGGGTLIGELKEVADKVAEKAKEYKTNEEAMMEAPDHFLDPIMSTLMTDPVILPSSRQTVDRTTIARHLLSDQSDPFNRSPLTMDQVIPNKELAEEVRQWMQGRLGK